MSRLARFAHSPPHAWVGEAVLVHVEQEGNALLGRRNDLLRAALWYEHTLELRLGLLRAKIIVASQLVERNDPWARHRPNAHSFELALNNCIGVLRALDGVHPPRARRARFRLEHIHPPARNFYLELAAGGRVGERPADLDGRNGQDALSSALYVRGLVVTEEPFG